jgi:hypothetical protein
MERQVAGQCSTAIGSPIAIVGGEATGEAVEFVVGRLCDYGPHGDEQTEANARLIAAAPDLLAALQALAPYAAKEIGVPLDLCVSEPFRAARAAIRKATGS